MNATLPIMSLIPYRPPLYIRPRPLAYPPLHSQHPNHHRLRTLPLSERALVAYLPVFTAKYFRKSPDIRRCHTDWLDRTPADLLSSNARDRLLREEDLLDALESTLEALRRDDYDGRAVPQEILEGLEDALDEDRCDTDALGESSRSFALRRFRAFAELSRVNRSRALGTVLNVFFLANVKGIARLGDDPSVLGEWCHAILRSFMREEDKAECFERLLRAQPDLIEELLDEPGEKARRVVEALAMVAADADERMDSRSRSRIKKLVRTADRPKILVVRDSEEDLGRYCLSRDEERYLRQLEAERESYREPAGRGRHGRLLEIELGHPSERRLLLPAMHDRGERRTLRLTSSESVLGGDEFLVYDGERD